MDGIEKSEEQGKMKKTKKSKRKILMILKNGLKKVENCLKYKDCFLMKFEKMTRQKGDERFKNSRT